MAVPDPPFSTPRIFKVLEPSAGQYEVVVKMDPLMASKFPDKPFGTAISEIGLAPKDADKYPGYILVSIEPADKGAKDHFWVFQKLSGPEWATTSKSKDNLTPAKFRGQTVVVKTEQEVAPDTQPTTLTGDLVSSVVTQTPNTGKAVLTEVTETIDENAAALVGEEYGDIVTKSVEETLVVDGTDADSGMDVISSVVDPQGNGKSVMQTKRVKGGVWPDPLERELSLDPPSIPSKLRRFIQRLTSKKKIGSIPATPTFGANEVGLGFKQETPDRVEKTTVTETVNLGTAPDEVVIDQKPFVKITATTKTQTSSVIPSTGNGSSRVIYDNGAGTVVWDNTAEAATARPGLKGVETTAQQWGKLVTTTNYTTSSSAPAGGSVQLIYNDGNVSIYEASTSVPGVGGSSSKDVDPQSWGRITWNGTFSTGTSGDKSRQVWSDGSTQVFLNETATVTPSGGKKDTDPQSWGKITWDGSYSSTSGGDKSNQVYSGPGGSVFLNETATVTPSGGSKDVDPQSWGQITWDGSYSSGSGGQKSRQVYSGPGGSVFLNETATVTPSGGSKDVEPREWGTLTWDGGFSSGSSGDKSRQVYSGPGGSVFLNETATIMPASGNFVSAREENALLTEEQKTDYGTSPNSGKNTRSRLVFNLKDKRVYENITIIRTPKAKRTYAGSIDVNIPSEIRSWSKYTFTKKDGTSTYSWEPDVIPGYRGPMAAEVTEYWVEQQEAVPVPQKIQPTPIQFRTPLGGFSVSETLHNSYRFWITTGTEHPEYTYQIWEVTLPATTPPSLQGQKILYHVDSQPYREGFVIREYRVQL